MRLLYLLPLALFVVLLGYFAVGLQRDPHLIPSAMIDKPAPEFALPALLPDKPGVARADLDGPLIVNFFASWCIPCRAEHPMLGKLAGDGVTVLGIAWKDKPDAARAWLKELGDPYRRVGIDQDGRVGIDFGVYGVPETYVIDRTGKIRYRQALPLTPADINDKIRPLLAALKQ
jgi:cytochrome c biogenesis protein CcmG/thiol:disulfide interchange protein DsbE